LGERLISAFQRLLKSATWAVIAGNEDAGSVVEGKKSEKLQTELQTGRRDQSTLAPKQRLRDEASQ
jgi:hypothetical protein